VTTYTYAQLEGLWVNAGGSSATAPFAAAIAEAESGGQEAVTSANPDGGTNVGPWQIDTTNGYSAEYLSNGANNAAAAVSMSQGGANWGDWETYVNGAYKAFLNSGTTADTTGLPAATAVTTAATTSSTTCALSVPLAGCIFQKSALRGLIGGLCLAAAGGVGLLAAVIFAASAFNHTGAGQAVATVTRTAAKVGAVVAA
jgi:hypothetical protein